MELMYSFIYLHKQHADVYYAAAYESIWTKMNSGQRTNKIWNEKLTTSTIITINNNNNKEQ
ncbi:hypothetical protein DERP_015051 [Dermatophagoides pteronyssinus]|uniref:Uncharacterized protein n=1 Tax=Dermatophagoides pteronyssinus TaxID=6956 RepID=A0ABQ8J5W3_DERPT|nr:hypothetical protein DERP_015051 [Dermatophagoides pteronyssinus]